MISSSNVRKWSERLNINEMNDELWFLCAQVDVRIKETEGWRTEPDLPLWSQNAASNMYRTMYHDIVAGICSTFLSRLWEKTEKSYFDSDLAGAGGRRVSRGVEGGDDRSGQGRLGRRAGLTAAHLPSGGRSRAGRRALPSAACRSTRLLKQPKKMWWMNLQEETSTRRSR